MVPGSSPGEPTTYFTNITRSRIFRLFYLNFKIFFQNLKIEKFKYPKISKFSLKFPCVFASQAYKASDSHKNSLSDQDGEDALAREIQHTRYTLLAF